MTYYLVSPGLSADLLLYSREPHKLVYYDIIHKPTVTEFTKLECSPDFSQVIYSGEESIRLYPDAHFTPAIVAHEIEITGVFNALYTPVEFYLQVLSGQAEVPKTFKYFTHAINAATYLNARLTKSKNLEVYPVLLRGSNSLRDVSTVYTVYHHTRMGKAYPRTCRILQLIPTPFTDADLGHIETCITLQSLNL